MYRLKTAALMSILLFTASCSVISSEVRREAEPTLAFNLLEEEANSYLGKTVIVGGYILETENLPDKMSILVLQAPLGFRDEPKSKDKSQGRFIVFHKGFLDPAVYRKWRKITVAGIVTGLTTANVENCPNQCVNLESYEIHLWPEYHYHRPRYYPPFGDPPYPPRLFPYDPAW